jgi:hypothetical protein
MNSEIKKKIKKPKKPKSIKPTKKGRSKDKSVKQLVNVNVTSSGGGGSGGASIPSAQPSYNPMLYQSSMAEKEASKGLLRSLEQLTKKQDDISALVKSLEKKPEDIMIKQEIQRELNNEDVIQNNIEDDFEENPYLKYGGSDEGEADESAGLIIQQVKADEEARKEDKRKLREQIRALGGVAGNAETLDSLRNKLTSLQILQSK